ncbi:MAG TPA: lysyl oxidase family protein [Polyangiaceae bacterium]
MSNVSAAWKRAAGALALLLVSCSSDPGSSPADAGMLDVSVSTDSADVSMREPTEAEAASPVQGEVTAPDGPESSAPEGAAFDAGGPEASTPEAGAPDAGEPDAATVAGALLHVTTSSRVGVLLDEIPAGIRARVAATLLAKPDSFWIARAKRQLALATYRLNFRAGFYDEADAKMQLPLPPDEIFNIAIARPGGVVARRARIQGHDYVVVNYTLDSMIVTDEASPGMSEPALSTIGGTWDEPFTFPVDPELLVQRTGYACMDEAEFPPNSVDTEDVEFFYDQECEVEDELTPDGCHYTQLPAESCLDALTAHVGSVDAPLHFERLPWDEAVAAPARVGAVTARNASDLQVVGDELLVNRLTYRYIEASSCALAEQCVSGSGWRRLLQFNASEKNLGTAPVNIGDIDYFVDTPDAGTANANHHIYEYSACHHHYHFSHYATFTYGGDPNLGSKRAFCLQSVARYSNNEYAPTWSPYGDCSYQGISQGWGDQYNAGIECQWVDVTGVDTSSAPVTKPLGLRSNPDGFLCEGTPVLDGAGNLVWEPTQFMTSAGETVDRPQCDFIPNWDSNNYAEQSITLPLPGEGMVTSPCARGQVGRLRNCGFSYDHTIRSCTPGSTFSMRCTKPANTAPEVVRICEGSAVLGAGVACTSGDALATAEIVNAPVNVTFECPPARDATEPGGSFAFYTAPSFTEDTGTTVTCTPN